MILLCVGSASGVRQVSPHTPLCAKAHLGGCASATNEQKRRRLADLAARSRMDCSGDAALIPSKCVTVRHSWMG